MLLCLVFNVPLVTVRGRGTSLLLLLIINFIEHVMSPLGRGGVDPGSTKLAAILSST